MYLYVYITAAQTGASYVYVCMYVYCMYVRTIHTIHGGKQRWPSSPCMYCTVQISNTQEHQGFFFFFFFLNLV